MNGKRIFSLAAAALLAGGLFAGSSGWAAADDHPMSGRGDAVEQGSGMMGHMMSAMMDGTTSQMMGGMMDEVTSDAAGPDTMGSMMGGMGDMMDDHHDQMLTTMAAALGLTVEELQAEFEAGKMVPQIAEEQGVSLADLHEEVMSEFGMHSR